MTSTDTVAGTPERQGPRPVSYSELDVFRQCPMKWQLGYLEGWKPTVEKEAFRLGHIWHEIMAIHYGVIKEYQESHPYNEVTRSPQRGTSIEIALLEKCAGEIGPVLDKVDFSTRQLMEWAYSGYVEQYGCDPDWVIKAIEIKGESPLPDSDVPLVWVIDLVVEDLDYGGTWIVDHKFPGDLATDTEIELDDQLGLYWLAWVTATGGIEGRAARVNGAMLNEARKKQNVGDLPADQRGTFKNGKPKGTPQTLEQRFRRSRTNLTVNDLNAIGENAVKAIKAMKILAENDLLYSSPNPKQCAWKCDFKEIHIISRSSGIPIREMLEDFGFANRTQREKAARVTEG